MTTPETPPWADPQTVIDGWLLDADLLPTEKQIRIWIRRAQTLIEDTRRAVAPRSTSIAQRIETDRELAQTVSDVVVAMVERVFANPEGVRSAMDVTGPLTGSVTYGGDNPGTLDVTAKEMRRLGISKRRQRAFSVPTSRYGGRSW